MVLTIGSGDTSALLSGKKTKAYANLLRKFVDENKPYWNSLASPIDALRTGAILENRFALVVDEDNFCQVKATSDEYDCLTASLDFAKLRDGKVIDFTELKTIFFTEYISFIEPMKEMTKSEKIDVVKSKFRNNYKQVQFQLLCTGLESAGLTFLSVYSYDDEENNNREIKEGEYLRIEIPRDEDIIKDIKNRAGFFQWIKDDLKD